MPYFIKAGAGADDHQYKKGPIGLALVTLVVLFGLALVVQSCNAAAATVLFDCFKVLFTASLALFGFEAHGTG